MQHATTCCNTTTRCNTDREDFGWPVGRRINLLGLRKHLVPSLNAIAPLLPALTLSDPELSLDFYLLLATINAEVGAAHVAALGHERCRASAIPWLPWANTLGPDR